jgi:hypothetical protein
MSPLEKTIINRFKELAAQRFPQDKMTLAG